MQEKKKLAIEVDNVQKIYKLYDKPSDRMKEAFGFGKKTKHKLHYALKGVDMKSIMRSTMYPFRCIREKQWELSEQMVPVNPRS